MERIKNWSIPKRLIAALLALAVLASAAAAVTLTLWDEADAKGTLTGPNSQAMDDFMRTNSQTSGNSDNWIDYLNERLHEQIDAFVWTETGITENWKWNGASATVSGENTASNPAAIPVANSGVWTVYSGQQLKYALEHVSAGQTIRLGADIDMAGYDHNWTTVSVNASITIDGQNHTIYNLGVYSNTADYTKSLFVYVSGKSISLTVKDLSFVSAKLVNGHTASLFLFETRYDNETNKLFFKNVHASDCLVYSPTSDNTSAGTGVFYCSAREGTIERCSVEGSTVYGSVHVGSLGGISDCITVSYSYAVDNTIISTGGHSGGFISCSNIGLTVENCFTNSRVYGNGTTGVFIGLVHGDGHFANCYASGSVEGTLELGGFVGTITENRYTLATGTTFKNCYSTSIVGMRSTAVNEGSFIGKITNSSAFLDGTPIVTITNCYGAGEVGGIDTIVDGTHASSAYNTVGGFVGGITITDSAIQPTLQNNYYDKQTTAMREWASGESQTVSGITGKLTTTTEKSGTGMTDPAFAAQLGDAYNSDFGDGYYPQLDVFSNATAADWGSEEIANMVKAYSQASVSTVHLDTYDVDYNGDPLPETTYDTVRDLTSMFPLTSDSNLSWQRAGVTGEPTLATGTGAKSAVKFGNMDMNVLHLYQADDIWYASQPMPGVDWLRVETNVGGQVGMRELRVCPTVGLDAGLSRYIGINTVYDHADDVKLAYTTGARQAADIEDITYGVFPDVPLASEQKTLLDGSAYANTSALQTLFETQNDKFSGIDVLHMQRTGKGLTEGVPSITAAGGGSLSMEVYRVSGEAGDGGVETVEKLNLANPDEASRWNGKTVFATGDNREIYDVEYVWSLADGRYLVDTKRIEYPAHTHTVTIRAENRNHQIIPNRVYLDAYSVSTEDGKFDGSITHDFGPSPKPQDMLSGQSHAYPAATAWQLRYGEDNIYELRIRLTTIDANSMYYETTVPGDELPKTPGESTTVTLTAPYKSYSFDMDGNIIWRLTKIEKEYTITLDDKGVYNIDFNLEYADNENGVYVDDLDMDIFVTVVLDSTEEPEDPETPSFVFGNQRVDAPWANDNADVVNEMPPLDGGGEN